MGMLQFLPSAFAAAVCVPSLGRADFESREQRRGGGGWYNAALRITGNKRLVSCPCTFVSMIDQKTANGQPQNEHTADL